MAPGKQGLRLIVSFAKWWQIVPRRLELVVLITEQRHLFIRVFHHYIGSLFQCVNKIGGSHYPEFWMNWKSPGNVNYTLKICELETWGQLGQIFLSIEKLPTWFPSICHLWCFLVSTTLVLIHVLCFLIDEVQVYKTVTFFILSNSTWLILNGIMAHITLTLWCFVNLLLLIESVTKKLQSLGIYSHPILILLNCIFI